MISRSQPRVVAVTSLTGPGPGRIRGLVADRAQHAGWVAWSAAKRKMSSKEQECLHDRQF
jgi:hypothetical protein